MDDSAALAVMQRFGKASFIRDPVRFPEAHTADALFESLRFEDIFGKHHQEP